MAWLPADARELDPSLAENSVLSIELRLFSLFMTSTNAAEHTSSRLLALAVRLLYAGEMTKFEIAATITLDLDIMDMMSGFEDFKKLNQ